MNEISLFYLGRLFSFVFDVFSEKCERFLITNYTLQVSNSTDLLLSTNSQIGVGIAYAKLCVLFKKSNLSRK